MEQATCNDRATTVQLRATPTVQRACNGRSNTPPKGGCYPPCARTRATDWSTQDSLLDDVPQKWSGPHVGRRLCDAMKTLASLPMGIGGGHSTWPPYAYEWADLLAQNEQGELERTQHQQNTIRLLPSCREMTRMEIAICWPAQFLRRLPDLLCAVNAVSHAHALDRDSGWVTNKRGGYADTWRQHHDRGCEIIARGLRLDRVPVF